VIEIWLPSEIVLGAVKVPSLAMEPDVVVQVTAELLDPLTVAVNCCLAPAVKVTFCGETATWIDGVEWDPWPSTLQPRAMPARTQPKTANATLNSTNVNFSCEQLGDTVCDRNGLRLDFLI
jgi:hypothetical protein